MRMELITIFLSAVLFNGEIACQTGPTSQVNFQDENVTSRDVTSQHASPDQTKTNEVESSESPPWMISDNAEQWEKSSERAFNREHPQTESGPQNQRTSTSSSTTSSHGEKGPWKPGTSDSSQRTSEKPRSEPHKQQNEGFSTPPPNVDTPLVINGQAVDNRSNNGFSHLARVYFDIPLMGTSQCTGSLISTRFVLTAGHCVCKGIFLFFLRIKYKNFQVVLGDLSATNTSESGEQTLSGKGIPYPFYPSSFTANDPTDIALIKLASSAVLSPTVQTIGLPSSTYVPAQGTSVLISGWGIYQPGGSSASDQLRTGIVTVASSSSCSAKLSTKQICMEPSTLNGSQTSGCNGDSGGPLYIETNAGSANPSYTVIAVVSFGTGGCPLTDAFGTVAVAPYLSWINKYI